MELCRSAGVVNSGTLRVLDEYLRNSAIACGKRMQQVLAIDALSWPSRAFYAVTWSTNCLPISRSCFSSWRFTTRSHNTTYMVSGLRSMIIPKSTSHGLLIRPRFCLVSLTFINCTIHSNFSIYTLIIWLFACSIFCFVLLFRFGCNILRV